MNKFNENKPEEFEAVHKCLSILENMMEVRPDLAKVNIIFI